MKNNKLFTINIRNLFDFISLKYDFLNRLLSLRQDVYWRKKMVSLIKTSPGKKILDVACGTGDVIIEIMKQKGVLISVFGIDVSLKMITIAKNKIDNLFYKKIEFMVSDVSFMAVATDSFDVITIAFGIRNIKNRISVLQSFYTALRPGGILVVLELFTPKKNNLLSNIYIDYFRVILPKIGKLFSKHIFAYEYLFDSVFNFSDSKTFVLMMSDVGFTKIVCKKLTLGVANIFVGFKN